MMRRCCLVFLFACSLLITTISHAQHSGYLVRNYSPKEYGGFNQMWDATQDHTGLLFFGCTSNIFIYDGQTWEKVPVQQGGATRRVFFDSLTKTVYVGSVSDFGYLQRAFNGQWIYISLLPKVPEAARQFADIWEIHQQGEDIVFQASERIFIFSRTTLKTIIEAPAEDKRFALMFSANDRVFVRQRTVGFNEIVNGKLQLLPGGERFANVRVLGIIPWDKQRNLVITGDQGFVIMNPVADPQTHSCFSEFPLPPDDFLLNAVVLGGKWINDSLFALNSRKGVGIYNRSGKLVRILDKQSGMSDETIAGLFVDREKNLWVMHNNGISRIAVNSPMLYFTDKSGLNGSMEMCLQLGDSLFVATTQGLFVRKGQGIFTQIDFPIVEVWGLFNYKGDILAATTMGFGRVSTGEFFTAYNVSRIMSTPVPGELITAEKGAIGYYKIEPFGKVTESRVVELNDDVIHLSTIDTVAGHPELREFWCNTRFNELLHVLLNVTTGTADIDRYDASRGWSDAASFMAEIGDSVYFFKSDSAFRYVPADDQPGKKCFKPAPDIFNFLATGDLSKVKQPFDCHLFLNDKKLHGTIVFGQDKNGKLVRQTVVANHFYGPMNIVAYATIDTEGMVWMMSNEIVTRIDPRVPANMNVPYRAMIRRVVIGEDSALFYGSNEPAFVNDSALPYRNNSISFRYSAPFFDYEEHLVFSYKLEGYDTAWSKWSRQTVKDYTNLPEGTYTFLVKATNTFSAESEPASYTFTILPPWYRTVWAYVGYTFAFLFLLILSVRISARRLRKQKERLELLVSERTAEVVEQKQQIEAQKIDLEAAYTGIQDSILYSQRIQQAILPTHDDILKLVPDSFVLFVPRDIVSGDFYWLAEKNDMRFIACVDCTGHGVPGALMSMIGNTLLNQTVLEKNITSPNEILNSLHIGVRHALKQDAGGDTRDGMDLALIAINKSGTYLEYAGANRSLWIVRNGSLLETKADKFPIAGAQIEETRLFTRHTVALEPGDCIYLCTDGYADQFGGPKGKKFMVKQMTRLLTEIYDLPMVQQRTILEHKFNEWRGGVQEQVDDVLVIGIRV